MIYLPSKKTYFPTYLPMYMTYFLTEWGFTKVKPDINSIDWCSLGGPLPEEVKHRARIHFDFLRAPFHSTRVSERGHPPRHEAKMDFFVPFVFSLVFGLMRFDRIGSLGTNKFNDPTLLSKIK
jgi:hypothetical protein